MAKKIQIKSSIDGFSDVYHPETSADQVIGLANNINTINSSINTVRNDIADIRSKMNSFPTNEMTLYVSTTGTNSTTRGTTSSTPLRTIQYAIDLVPKINFRTDDVTIFVADGTYNESVRIQDYYGSQIALSGGEGPNSVIVSSITVQDCDRVNVAGFTSTSNISFDRCHFAGCINNHMVNTGSSSSGMSFAEIGLLGLRSVTVSNRSTALVFNDCGVVQGYWVDGTGNTQAIINNGSIIKLYRSNITGTKSVNYGGQTFITT